MASITTASYAKVNLTLEVLSKLPSGYHELDSVAQVIDLADEISVAQAPEGTIDVTTDAADVPSGHTNVVHKACSEFFRLSGTRGGAKCSIRKRIPVQAGLGGGSSNAAAALIALDRLYSTGLSRERLMRMAAEVGSDVPLFIASGTVRMRGRGDRIELLPDAPRLHLVIIKPPVGVSTGWAYAELDRQRSAAHIGSSDAADAAVRSGERESLIEALWNDFDPVVAAAFPEVMDAKRILVGFGAKRAMLCGSGSAVFGVFETLSGAESAADGVRPTGAEVFVSSFLAREERLQGRRV